MALETIYKNVGSFLEILQNAATDQVTRWNENSVQNAYKWAAYSEQIYRQAEGKPYWSNLDAGVKKVAQALGINDNLPMGLAVLQEGSRLISTTLLLNYLAKPDILLEVFKHHDLNLDTLFLENSGWLSDVKIMQDMASFLKDTLCVGTMTWKGTIGDKTDLSKSELAAASSRILVSCHSELLMIRLTEPLLETDEQKKRMQRFLREKLRALSGTDHGMNVIVMMSIKVSSHEDEQLKRLDVKVIILECLMAAIKRKSSCMWNLPSLVLCHLCMDYPSLHREYLGYLTRCGDQMKMTYNAGSVHNPRDLFQWKLHDSDLKVYSKEHVVDFPELVNRLNHLLKNSSSRLVASTIEYLNSLVKLGGDTCVWTSVVKEIRPT